MWQDPPARPFLLQLHPEAEQRGSSPCFHLSVLWVFLMGGMPAFSASMQRLVLPPHPRPLPPELWLAPFDTASASLALLSPPVTLPSPLRLLHRVVPPLLHYKLGPRQLLVMCVLMKCERHQGEDILFGVLVFIWCLGLNPGPADIYSTADHYPHPASGFLFHIHIHLHIQSKSNA